MRARTEWMVLLPFVLAGCKGGPGDIGPAGLSVADGGVTTQCQAGSNFCDGTMLLSCTHSGVNAVTQGDCNSLYWYGGSANNPGACSTTHCGPYDHGACCTSQKPTCVWSISSPISSNGSSYVYTPAIPACYVSSASPCAGTGDLYFQWSNQDSRLCQSTAYTVYLDLPRASFPGGFPKTIILPNSFLYLAAYTTTGANTTSCTSWTGTVTWTSDAPTWSVTINATSAAPCPAGLVVSATFNGDV